MFIPFSLLFFLVTTSLPLTRIGLALSVAALASEREALSRSVQASGTIAAANVADLAFPSTGTVNSVKVTIGEKVTKGQALASIDRTSLQLAVNSAQASYNQAAAQLSSAEANLSADRAALAATKATPTSTTTTAADLATQEANEQAQIDSANAQIAADESSLAGAQDKVDSAKANTGSGTRSNRGRRDMAK